ncbi:MAG: hypothetical protein PHP95_10715 [Desulfuromonadaceae bacterium]|nr:hypothetical protein [Desulfuromonadaceae bacterium]MDD2848917.1 hypothetical protein [Desulfuromonadaceae bacterium]MDD4132126.1 hypothetical protein [Desulfuromonadaceae bacterium]
MINYVKLFKKLNQKHYDAAGDLWDKRKQWEYVNRTATKVFNEAIEVAKETGFWESLFILPRPQKIIREGEVFKNRNFIQLCVGQHPTDISSKTYKCSRLRGRRVVTESGGALIIAQLSNGGVTFTMLSSSSEVHNNPKEIRMLKVFKRPYDIDESDISKAVRVMLKFNQNTSYSQFYPYWNYLLDLASKHKKDILIMLTGAFLGTLLGTISSLIISSNSSSSP